MPPETDDPPSTSTLEAARAHARSLAAAAGGQGPTIPAGAAVDLPDGVAASDVVWDEVVPGGNYASHLLRRGHVLRLTDLEGEACVQLLLHRRANPAERLNVADTVKVQWQAYLTAGTLLLSDLGRVLATIVDDTSGCHDALCGGTNRRTATERWGDGSASGPTPNARDLLVLGAAKHGLGRADVGPCLDLFTGARVADDGGLALVAPVGPGAHVDLRAEVDLIVVLATTPHPLDDRPEYHAGPIRATAWAADRPDPDPFRSTSPERLRAFENTESLLAGTPA